MTVKQIAFISLAFALHIMFYSSNNLSMALDVTPTPPDTDLRTFPRDLVCNEIQEINDGPSWHNVIIGRSTISELREQLSSLSDEYQEYDVQLTSEGLLQFRLTNGNPSDERIPGVIDACVLDNIIVALKISVPMNAASHFTNLLAIYGSPF